MVVDRYAILKTVDINREEREKIWCFLKELVGLTKSIQPSNVVAFFR